MNQIVFHLKLTVTGLIWDILLRITSYLLQESFRSLSFLNKFVHSTSWPHKNFYIFATSSFRCYQQPKRLSHSAEVIFLSWTFLVSYDIHKRLFEYTEENLLWKRLCLLLLFFVEGRLTYWNNLKRKVRGWNRNESRFVLGLVGEVGRESKWRYREWVEELLPMPLWLMKDCKEKVIESFLKWIGIWWNISTISGV